MYSDNNLINGGGQPTDFSTPAMIIDGAYKSNNRNLGTATTSSIPIDIGSWNKMSAPASEPRPFSKA